jgi:hypothetical protein
MRNPRKRGFFCFMTTLPDLVSGSHKMSRLYDEHIACGLLKQVQHDIDVLFKRRHKKINCLFTYLLMY